MYPALGACLRAYARDPSSWESVLRALVRRGADLHAPVRRSRQDMKEIRYPCLMAEYGTPLDELFTFNRDCSAARIVANGWLRILTTEGHSASLYLKKEWTLRARDMHFTHPSTSSVGYDSPRKLFFKLGDRPSVHWDWWIDPASSTSLLRQEFKCLVTTSPDWLMISQLWKESWPFVYPKWSKLHQGYARGSWYLRCIELLEFANKRAERRNEKKAVKAARAQGFGTPRRIPGAWPL